MKNKRKTRETNQVMVKGGTEILDNVEASCMKQETLALSNTGESDECDVDVSINNLVTVKIEEESATNTIPIEDSIPQKVASNVIMEIRPSKIYGKGAFATSRLPIGMQFGPYEGDICRVASSNSNHLKLTEDKEVPDGSKSISNWMQYINYAKNRSQQNLEAFQHKGTICYRTVRPIEKDEELLVYDESFAEILGIDYKEYDGTVDQNQDLDFCQKCQIVLGNKESKQDHEKCCTFRENDTLDLNIRMTYECCYCQRYFNSTAYKARHEIKCSKRKQDQMQKRKVNENGKRFFCSKCDYKTSIEGDFKRHYLIHDKDHAQWFYCNMCEFKSIRKDNLRTHQKIHLETCTLTCKFCNKQLNQIRELDSHLLNNHRNEIDISEMITSKIHHCPKCAYQTVYLSDLKKHMLNHKDISTDLPKLSCEYCDYTSYRASTMKRHVFTHTKIKPYLCTECNETFNRKVKIDSHIVRKHPNNEGLMATITNKIFECEHCSFKCLFSTNFKSHMKTKHS